MVRISHKFSYTDYTFDVVERLTPTLAVTKRGVKIRNEPKTTLGEGFVFGEQGDQWRQWQRSTPDIMAAALAQKKVIESRAWLRDAKFTDEEVVRLKEIFENEVANLHCKTENQ